MKAIPDWISQLSSQARIGGQRVFLDDQAYSPEGEAEVVRRLIERLDRIKRSRNWAATAMGIKPGVLSGAINGSLENPETIIRSVDKWLEAQFLKAQAARPSGFARTRAVEMIYAAARLLQENGGIVMVHGPSGVGKTLARRPSMPKHPARSTFRSARRGRRRWRSWRRLARRCG